MTCDEDCGKTATVVVATARPSDPTEIVAVLAWCDEHADIYNSHVVTMVSELAEWSGDYQAVGIDTLEEYIESVYARNNHHLFLSI